MDNLITLNQSRNRAWRRWQNRKNRHQPHGQIALGKPEKNWKWLYTRSVKIHRAKQLGFIYHLRETDFNSEWFD